MIKNSRTVVGVALSLVLAAAAAMVPAHAQPPRFLSLEPPSGLPVVPVMEGWYGNADGSRTISFGYYNKNSAESVDIPIGENNYIEPAEFNGSQPTHFIIGRDTGVFTVTLPPNMADEDVWWYLKTGNNEILKVPGRAGEGAYELDHRPRPQGTVSPEGWLEPGGEVGIGPVGVVSEAAQTVSVNTAATFTVHARDPSERDLTDPRFAEPVPIRLTWFKHQGPGEVEFSRHPSTETVSAPSEDEDDGGQPAPENPPEVVRLAQGEGTANIIATFSEPGDYLLRARIDNWSATDSSQGNQCCWTNIYQRVTVTP
ncbi:MAG: hypothetical protein WDZ76_11380 [Pseudohongiellaceae bacterium]